MIFCNFNLIKCINKYTDLHRSYMPNRETFLIDLKEKEFDK